MYATTEFVVPRSTPIRNEKAPAILPSRPFANIQLQLPAVRSVTRYAPDLERAEFGYASLEPHRDNGSLLAIQFKRDLQRTELLDIGAPIFQQAADLVLFADTGIQETKLGWLTDDEAKLSAGNRGLGAFLHAKGNDAERLERSFHAGHCRHGAFNSDVVRARGATADTHAAPAPRLPVIGSTARNGVFQVGSFQDLQWPERVQTFFS